MIATVLPLKEALTTESCTAEGSKNYGIMFYLLLSGGYSKLRRKQDRVTQESGPEYYTLHTYYTLPKNRQNSWPDSYNSSTF